MSLTCNQWPLTAVGSNSSGDVRIFKCGRYLATLQNIGGSPKVLALVPNKLRGSPEVNLQHGIGITLCLMYPLSSRLQTYDDKNNKLYMYHNYKTDKLNHFAHWGIQFYYGLQKRSQACKPAITCIH